MIYKIGYYPILDMVLALRQTFCLERFKPFNYAQESFCDKLTPREYALIDEIAASTTGWLSVLEKLIGLTLTGVISPEELLLETAAAPQILFGDSATTQMSQLLTDLWYNTCHLEIARHNSAIQAKSLELASAKQKGDLIDYLLTLSDRFEKIDSETLKFNVKPDLTVKLADIEHVIVMPSVYASRNLTFWYNGNAFLFFVGLSSHSKTLEEPSDMVLLRASAFNDKTRLKMLHCLAKSSASVNDMSEVLGLNASTASRHFKLFKDAGFVELQSQEGNTIYYSLNKSEIRKALDSILAYITQ